MSQSIAKFWTDWIEYPLWNVGLLESPAKRFFVITAGSAALLWITKPRTLFDDKGEPKPWKYINKTDPKGVPFDWVTASLFFGGLSILFV